MLSTIPATLLISSLVGYENNNFVKYLLCLFGFDITVQLISRYNIGTSKYWPGATVFWQADVHGKIRSGKIMKYDTHTGRRIKKPFNHITWVHSVLKKENFELRQYLFGEHLLGINWHGCHNACPDNFGKLSGLPIAIAESEKTAIIASVYLPQFVWLACGSLTNLTIEKCKVLAGRHVILFPDLNGYGRWREKAKELRSVTSVTVSNLLDRKANSPERANGFDLADYLVRFDAEEFLDKQ